MIAILGDLHIGASSNSATVWEHQMTFFTDVFFPFLERHPEIKTVIQTGDFFDNRTAVHHTAMYNAKWIVDMIGRLDRRLIVLVGNHDIPYKNTNDFDSIWPVIGSYGHVEIVQSPTTFTILDMLIVPWISPENQELVHQRMTGTMQQYCVGHFDIIGGKFSKHGQVSSHGLDTSNLSQFKRVISGHYHTRSKIGNVDFVGTPYELDWNDWNDPKGFHTFDPATNDLKFYPSDNHLFYKVVQSEGGVEIIPPNPSNDFSGKIVKVESTSSDKGVIRSIIDKIGEATSIQTIMTQNEELVADIADYESKSVVQVLLETADRTPRPEQVRTIISRALEKVKQI